MTGQGVSSRLVSSRLVKSWGVVVVVVWSGARTAVWRGRLAGRCAYPSIRDPASVLGGGQSEIVMFLFFSLFCAMRTLAQGLTEQHWAPCSQSVCVATGGRTGSGTPTVAQAFFMLPREGPKVLGRGGCA